MYDFTIDLGQFSSLNTDLLFWCLEILNSMLGSPVAAHAIVVEDLNKNFQPFSHA